MGDFSTFAGLGGSGAPPDLLNLGYPISGTGITPPVDITAILDQLGLAPQPIDLGIPPPTPIDIPTLPPVDTLPPPPIIDIFPPPIDVGLPQPQPLPPPPGTITIFPGGQIPIGYDANGNPIYSTTTALPPLPPGPSTPPPAVPPITSTPPPVTVTSTQVSGGGSAYAQATATASINQSIQVMNQDVQPLAQAVQQGIQDAAQKSADIANQTTQAITQSLNGFSNELFGWVKSLGQWIRDNIGSVLSTIGNAIKNSLETIGRIIADSVSAVVKTIADTLGPLVHSIVDEVAKIAQFYQDHIAPILNAIANIQRAVAVAITAIERDIQTGLSGILKLPGDLVAAFSSIDQALIRAGKALKAKTAADADYYYVTADGKGFAEHLQFLGDGLMGKATRSEKTTYAPGFETLNEPTLAQELPQLLTAMNQIALDIANGIRNVASDPAKLVETLGVGAATFWLGLLEPLELLAAFWEIMKTPLEVVGELAGERVREVTQLSKLDPQTLATAWQRNLIDAATMDNEMRVQGYNSERSQLLRRLTFHVEDPQTLVDYLYRGVITDDDFSAGGHVLGFTAEQIQALKDASVRIIDVQTALTAFQYGQIDEPALDEALRINRFTDEEAALFKTTALKPSGFADAYPAYWVRRILEAYSQPPPTTADIPDEVQNAGLADGLNGQAVLDRWTAGINTIPAQAWLALFWRGQADLTALQAALDRDRVPSNLQPSWIEAQRPLIPFRTIPGMVKAGLMDNLTAIEYLKKHGYSDADAILLMEYANRTTSLGSATRASTHHATSLSVAKTAYDDGLISRDQYVQILGEHGLDANAISLEVQLTDIEREAKARKQIGVDIINEYQAGLIDQQTALDRIHSSGYTLAEQAGVERKLRSARAGKAKIPDEAQQRAFAKADIITVDAYEAALVTLGYSETDAANFRQLHFPV